MSEGSIIDREARDVLGECIRQFLEVELELVELEFDELEFVARKYASSKDSVVKHFVTALYIEELDVPQSWPKQSWDEVQRWLLLLDSDRQLEDCLLYTSPSPRDLSTSRMPSSA